MSDREYLNEEQYRNTTRRLRIVSLVMIVLGLTGFIGCGILILVLQLVAFALQTFAMMEDVVCFGCGLVIPVLFITGALMMGFSKDKVATA